MGLPSWIRLISAFILALSVVPNMLLSQEPDGFVSLTFTDAAISKSRTVCLNCFANGHFQLVDSATVSQNKRFITLRFGDYTGTCELNYLGAKDLGAEFIANPKERISIMAELSGMTNGAISINNSVENDLYLRLQVARESFNVRLNSLIKLRQQVSPFQKNYLAELTQLDEAIEVVKDSINSVCDEIVDGHEELFVGRVTRNLVKLPTRNTSPSGKMYDTHNAFLHEHYFDYMDFNDSQTFHHYALNFLLDQYFSKYSSSADKPLYNSCDMLMKKAASNPVAQDYIYNYLVEYGLTRNMEYMVTYMKETYGNDCELRLPSTSSASLRAMNNTKVGSVAPDILLYDLSGVPQSLNRFVKDHEYTVLLFWISWCSRCHTEIPKIATMQGFLKTSNIGLFTVGLDENPTIWKDEILKYGLEGTHVSEQVPLEKSNLLVTYGVRTTPTLFVLDSEGKIVSKNIFGEKLENLLRELTQ